MTNGARYSTQRSNRVRLKADAAFLLDRIVALATPMSDKLRKEIAEMRIRLAPPPGVKAPIVFTGYTKDPKQ